MFHGISYIYCMSISHVRAHTIKLSHIHDILTFTCNTYRQFMRLSGGQICVSLMFLH